jgi:GTP-binding protein
VSLAADTVLSLDDALEYIADDELVDVTPASIRLRKKILRTEDRRRSQKPVVQEGVA